jgi:hypothetical protein
MRSFSSRVIDAPGLCSPSRKVVSKMISWSFMIFHGLLPGSDEVPSSGAAAQHFIFGAEQGAVFRRKGDGLACLGRVRLATETAPAPLRQHST